MRWKRSTRPKRPRFSLYPDAIVTSVDQIDITELRRRGITAIFVDLDGTVVARDTFVVSKNTMRVFRSLAMPIYIATNRAKSRDLKTLRQDLSAQGVIHPQGLRPKPSKHYFRHGLNQYGLVPEQTAMIGDRFVQDILGANRMGMTSILVEKLGPSIGVIDRIGTILERLVVRAINFAYR